MRNFMRGVRRSAAAAVLTLLPAMAQAQAGNPNGKGGEEAQARVEHTAAVVGSRPWWPAVRLEPRLAAPLAPVLELAAFNAEPQLTSRERNDAMLNGALITLGALGIYDNVVVHWILGWHRAIEDHPHTLEIEIGIVALSTAMLVTGIVRERRARRQ